MRFLYTTDVHDRFKDLKILFEAEKVDFAIISGDLLYRTFYNDDKLYDFIGLQESFYTKAKNLKLDMVPFDFAHYILAHPGDFTPAERYSAGYYQELFELSAKNIKQKYENLKGVLDSYAPYPTWVLPGNYDMDLKYTCLKERDLHRKSLLIDGVKFSAYGGAPIMTPGIPEKLSVTFDENPDFAESEIYKQFIADKPDIMLIHQPAYGFFDQIPSVGNIGSNSIREYVDDHEFLLCLSGHIHEDYGLKKTRNGLFLNPSNFGKVESMNGENNGGYYTVIDVGRKAGKPVIDRITMSRIVDGDVQTIFEFDAEKEFQPKVINNFEADQIPDFTRHVA